MTKRSKIILISLITAVAAAFLFTVLFNGTWLRLLSRTMPKEEAALRYPYQQLNRREQALYETLCKGIGDYAEEISLPDIYEEEEYKRVFLLICEQEPQYFYLDQVYETGERVNLVRMHYDVPESEIELMTAQMNLVADRIADQAKGASSEYQKLLTIHDAIADICEYTDGDYQDEAYGCLVEGKAKCEGYAKAMLYVARRAGLDIMNVTGITGKNDNHVWNIAKIGGEYYNFDITWDDDERFRGRTTHMYFALPDSMFGDHRADLRAFQPPACMNEEWGYYTMNGLVLTSADALKPMIESWAYDPMLMEFQFADDGVYKAVSNAISTDPTLGEAVKTASGALNFRAVADEMRRTLVILPS